MAQNEVNGIPVCENCESLVPSAWLCTHCVIFLCDSCFRTAHSAPYQTAHLVKRVAVQNGDEEAICREHSMLRDQVCCACREILCPKCLLTSHTGHKNHPSREHLVKCLPAELAKEKKRVMFYQTGFEAMLPRVAALASESRAKLEAADALYTKTQKSYELSLAISHNMQRLPAPDDWTQQNLRDYFKKLADLEKLVSEEEATVCGKPVYLPEPVDVLDNTVFPMIILCAAKLSENLYVFMVRGEPDEKNQLDSSKLSSSLMLYRLQRAERSVSWTQVGLSVKVGNGVPTHCHLMPVNDPATRVGFFYNTTHGDFRFIGIGVNPKGIGYVENPVILCRSNVRSIYPDEARCNNNLAFVHNTKVGLIYAPLRLAGSPFYNLNVYEPNNMVLMHSYEFDDQVICLNHGETDQKAMKTVGQRSWLGNIGDINTWPSADDIALNMPGFRIHMNTKNLAVINFDVTPPVLSVFQIPEPKTLPFKLKTRFANTPLPEADKYHVFNSGVLAINTENNTTTLCLVEQSS